MSITKRERATFILVYDLRMTNPFWESNNKVELFLPDTFATGTFFCQKVLVPTFQRVLLAFGRHEKKFLTSTKKKVVFPKKKKSFDLSYKSTDSTKSTTFLEDMFVLFRRPEKILSTFANPHLARKSFANFSPTSKNFASFLPTFAWQNKGMSFESNFQSSNS